MLRFWLIFIAVLGGLICALLAITAWRRRPAPGASFLAGAMACVTVYAMGYGLELSSSSLEYILACIRIEYLGVAWLPGFWIALALRYTNRLEWLKPRRFLLLWVIPILVILGVFTNPLHRLFYTSVAIDTSGPFSVLSFERGPIYWLHMGYTFFAFLAAAFLLIQYLLSPHALYRKQSGLLLLSSVLTILVTTLYLAGLQPIPHLDIIVYALIFAGGIVGWGLLRFHLVALSPIARETLFDNLRDAALVLDGADRLVDFNPEARRLLGLTNNPIGLPLEQCLPADFLPAFHGLRSGDAVREFTLERQGQPEYFEVLHSSLPGASGESQGLLVVVHDITRRQRLQSALEAINAELDERVKLRTQEYQETIVRLENEIETRQKAERQLKEMQNSLVEQVSAQSRKLSTLYDVLLYQGGTGDAVEIFNQSLARIMQMMNADATCMHEMRDGAIYLSGSIGLPEEANQMLAVLPGDWLSDGKPLVSINLPQEERLPPQLRLPCYTTYLAAPIKLNNATTGVLQVFWSALHSVSVEDIAYFSIIAEQIGVILENARLRKTLEDRAVQVERRRLARDLHDSVTQSLHSLSLYTGTLRNRLRQGQVEKAEEMLDRLDQSARQALKEMRLLLYEMRLAPLENLRLVETLQNRLEAVEKRAGIDAALLVDEPAHWPLNWEAEMYCIAMEALNNSLKHGNANQVRVNLRGSANWVEMSIQDDGRGFSHQKAQKTGIGLQSMRERAERLGGEIQIESTEGSGTTVCLRVGTPVAPEDEEARLDSNIDRG